MNIDRETPMLLPVDMRDWLPEDHLVHFILDAAGMMEMSAFKVNKRGTGSEQYPPRMMLALLVYCYVTGRFGSRTIETATYTDACGVGHSSRGTASATPVLWFLYQSCLLPCRTN